MDTLVLLGTFFVLMMIGVPIAYSLGLSALVGALWIDLPLDGYRRGSSAGGPKSEHVFGEA